MVEEMTCQNCYYRYHDPGYPPCEDCLEDKQLIGKLSKWVGAVWHDDKKTNADRIRSMTDEELADILSGSSCRRCPIQCAGSLQKTCADFWLDWLKQETET